MHAFGSRQAPAAIAVKKKTNEKKKEAMPARAHEPQYYNKQIYGFYLCLSSIFLVGVCLRWASVWKEPEKNTRIAYMKQLCVVIACATIAFFLAVLFKLLLLLFSNIFSPCCWFVSVGTCSKNNAAKRYPCPVGFILQLNILCACWMQWIFSPRLYYITGLFMRCVFFVHFFPRLLLFVLFAWSSL